MKQGKERVRIHVLSEMMLESTQAQAGGARLRGHRLRHLVALGALRGRAAIKGNLRLAHFHIYMVTHNIKNIILKYIHNLM